MDFYQAQVNSSENSSNSCGSYGSKMVAASKDQARPASGIKSISFYDGDSGPSYSFASESPLLNKCVGFCTCVYLSVISI